MKTKSSGENLQPVCIELLRVSTPKQVELGGLDSQHTDCQEIAKRHGVKLHAQALRLAGISGKNVRLTPEIQTLSEMLRTGQASGVVMVEDTRLMRPDEPEDYALLQVFKDTGAKIYTRSMVHDLSTPDGQMLMQILFSIAGRERHVIRQRTYGKREKLRSAGLLASAAHTLPLGVTRVPFHDGEAQRWAYAWDEVSIARVCRLFNLFISGEQSFTGLSRKTGISYYSVREILANPIYTGVRLYDTTVDPKRDVLDELGRLRYQTKVRRAEDKIERVPMRGADGKPLKPAVPLDVFAQAQKLLSLKSEMGWRRNNTNAEPFAFRGFIKCGVCGSHMLCVAHSSGGSKRFYYVCKAQFGQRRVGKDGTNFWQTAPGTCTSARMRREAIEPLLEDVVRTKLTDPDFLFQVMRSQRKAIERGDNRLTIQRLQKTVEATQGKLERNKRLFVLGDLTEAEYMNVRNALVSELESHKRALAEIKPDVPQVSPDALAHIIAPFAEWDTLTTADRRALLTAVAPVFKVTSKGNGGRGAGAHTQISINGFYLMLSAGDDAPNEDGRGNGKRRTRANTHSTRLVGNVVLSPTDRITDPLVYFPLSA